jgi:hypothetical protein
VSPHVFSFNLLLLGTVHYGSYEQFESVSSGPTSAFPPIDVYSWEGRQAAAPLDYVLVVQFGGLTLRWIDEGGWSILR